jgi:hypothetical protein
MDGQDVSADVGTAVASTLNDLDISTPVVVAWGSGAILTDVTLDLHQKASNNTALFKLRAALALKGLPSARTSFFLFIYPECIRSLELLDGSEMDRVIEPESVAAKAPDIARTKLGIDVTCLRFALNGTPDLIGPKDTVLTPKNKASGHILDSLRALSRQDNLIIYFPQNVTSQARLISLCEVICAGASRTSERQADLVTLYGGKGGQVLTNPGALANTDTTSTNPPSYDEIEPGPPPAPLTIPDGCVASKKRRRSGSPGGRLDPRHAETAWRRMMDEHKTEMRRAMDEHKTEMRIMMDEHKTERQRMMEMQQETLVGRLLADLRPCIVDEIGQLETRILGQLDTRILDQLERWSDKQALQQQQQQQRHRHDVDQQIENLGQEVTQLVDAVEDRVEDEFYGLRLRLEEFIKEEVAEVEERVVEHLQNTATISLDFTPWQRNVN